MQHSFMQKVVMTVVAGMVFAAVYVFFFRAIVERSIYENSNEGWREIFKATPAPKR
jgi:hypothetical protein